MEVWRMFYALKLYWLSCYNSCAESSSPFEHAKNLFLKRWLDTKLSQVLIDVKYTRYWQLGLNKENSLNKENFARFNNKTNNIHRKWSFPWRIYLINVNKSAVLCGYVHIY